MVPDVAGMGTPYSGASNALSTDSRADEVFHAHQQALFKRTDRMFAYLMGGQWLAAILFALVVAPRTWAGADSQVHVHVWAALILGGLVSLFPAALAVLRPGATLTRHSIASWHASITDRRRTRSSGGYPMIASSGSTTRSAPSAAAPSRAILMRARLPSMSPTVGLSCASAMVRFTGGNHEPQANLS